MSKRHIVGKHMSRLKKKYMQTQLYGRAMCLICCHPSIFIHFFYASKEGSDEGGVCSESESLLVYAIKLACSAQNILFESMYLIQ